jgi:hypothetical protein
VMRNCYPFYKSGNYHRQRSKKTPGWWRSISFRLVGNNDFLAYARRMDYHSDRYVTF